MYTPSPWYDAVIVGARCAGASTAMLLARAGQRVLVLDRSPEGSDALSTHALMRGGVLQLQRWGLLERVAASGTPAVSRTTFHYGERTVPVEIKPRDGVQALYAPRRTVLDAVLVQGAREAGAAVVHGVGVRGLLRDGRGRVRSVVTDGAQGVPLQVRAGVVIGADGLRSTVARLVGARQVQSTTHASATIYGYADGLELDGYHWYYGQGVSAGTIPTTPGPDGRPRACVFASLTPARFSAQLRSQGLEGLYASVLHEAAPGVAERLAQAPPAKLFPFAGVPGFLRQAHGPGWALVGDAGYFKDPITAHGITDALRDAELLARAVIEATPAALAGYQATRDELSAGLLRITEQLAALDWDLETAQQLHKAISQEMNRETELLAGLSLPAPRGLCAAG